MTESAHLLRGNDVEREAGSPCAEKESTNLRLFDFHRLSLLKHGMLYLASSKVQKRHEYTAALDGLRGFSAFIVVTYHWFLFFYDMNAGYIPGTAHAKWINLPFIKFFTNGIASVAIFFAVSGYALSYKPLKLARAKSWGKLHHTLSSSVFRRALRLYLPSLFNMFCLSILFWLGANEPGRQHIEEAWLGAGWYPPRPESLGSAIGAFIRVAAQLGNAWTWDAYRPTELDSNMWTILTEFRASMVLFLVLLGLCKVRRTLRVALFAAAALWALYGGRWDVVLFLVGSVLAEVDLEADSRQMDRAGSTGSPRRHVLIWSAITLVGIFLSSSPLSGSAVGYGSIMWFGKQVYPAEPQWCSWTLGATVLVYAATKANFLQRVLTSNIIQYLGHISYSMYIVHGALLRIVAYNFVPLLWRVWGREGAGYACGAIVGYFVGVAVLIPIADIFWRMVDAPSIRFAKWIESKFFVDDG